MLMAFLQKTLSMLEWGHKQFYKILKCIAYLYNKNILEYVRAPQRGPKSMIRYIEGHSNI